VSLLGRQGSHLIIRVDKVGRCDNETVETHNLPHNISSLAKELTRQRRPHMADEVEEPEPEPQARSSEGYRVSVGSAEAE
jgi:hypothetical protein